MAANAIDQAASGVDANGSLRVTIPIESIEHATGQLLGLGTDVEVLGPPGLRDRVHQTACAVAAWYRTDMATSG